MARKGRSPRLPTGSTFERSAIEGRRVASSFLSAFGDLETLHQITAGDLLAAFRSRVNSQRPMVH